MPIQFQFRRGTAAQWTATNPILAQGEPGFETDTAKWKIGDGATAWSSLSYLLTALPSGGSQGQILSKNSGNNYDVGWSNPPSNKNKIINGDLLVDQRNSGNSQTFTAAAAIAYSVDRMYASCTGANITGQQVAGVGSYSKSYKFTGAASNTGLLFGQRIESYNCRDLLSQNVVCQVELSSSSITSVTWTAYYANTTDTFSSKTQIATGTITINSTPTIYNFSFNAGANARNGIAIEFSCGALLASQTLYYSGVQLEKSSFATTFEFLQYQSQIALCQRHALLVPVGSVYRNVVTNANLGNENLWLWFPVEMRAVPTVPTITWSLTQAGTPSISEQTIHSIAWSFTETTANTGAVVYNSAAFVIAAEL